MNHIKNLKEIMVLNNPVLFADQVLNTSEYPKGFFAYYVEPVQDEKHVCTLHCQQTETCKSTIVSAKPLLYPEQGETSLDIDPEMWDDRKCNPAPYIVGKLEYLDMMGNPTECLYCKNYEQMKEELGLDLSFGRPVTVTIYKSSGEYPPVNLQWMVDHYGCTCQSYRVLSCERGEPCTNFLEYAHKYRPELFDQAIIRHGSERNER